jgi:hypothetical protein
MGMCVSDGTKFEVFGFGGEGSGDVDFTVTTWNTATSKNAGTKKQQLFSASYALMRDVWIRVWDDKTLRNWQWSLDGFTWVTLFSETRATFLTHLYVGWGGGWHGIGVPNWTANQLYFECQSWKYEDL